MHESLEITTQYWQSKLGLDDHSVQFDYLPPEVVYEHTAEGSFRQFEGVVIGVDLDPKLLNQKIIRILHTQEPDFEDLVHELLHIKHPGWSHEEVVQETEIILHQHS